jgi:hypothetical protein
MAKGEAKNQKDRDSTYTNNGGFSFTLPDEIRLKNKIESIIKIITSNWIGEVTIVNFVRKWTLRLFRL